MLKYDFKPGDLIGFSGRGFISDCVNIGTYGIPRWSISHVSIFDDLVFEANENNGMPCEITGRITGVRAFNPEQLIEKYKGRVWVYPLYRELYQNEKERLDNVLASLTGKDYDSIGALHSAGFLFSAIKSMIDGPNFVSLFCSEFVAKALSDIGVFPTSNASRWNPNKLLRRLRAGGIVCKPIRLK